MSQVLVTSGQSVSGQSPGEEEAALGHFRRGIANGSAICLRLYRWNRSVLGLTPGFFFLFVCFLPFNLIRFWNKDSICNSWLKFNWLEPSLKSEPFATVLVHQFIRSEVWSHHLVAAWLLLILTRSESLVPVFMFLLVTCAYNEDQFWLAFSPPLNSNFRLHFEFEIQFLDDSITFDSVSYLIRMYY